MQERELFVASAHGVALKKGEKENGYGEADGYLCVWMVKVLYIKQRKLNVNGICKSLLVDPGMVIPVRNDV